MNDNKAFVERAEKIKSKLLHCKSYKTKIELQTTMLEAADIVNQLISQFLAVTDERNAQLALKDKQLAAAVADLDGLCQTCKKYNPNFNEICSKCGSEKSQYEWRGA